jgi:hypothetical protein
MVIVRGLTSQGRVAKAQAAGDSSNASRTLQAVFNPGEGRDVFAALWVPGLTSVQSIALESVTYSDGSTWKLLGDNACRVAPEPIMLVNGR